MAHSLPVVPVNASAAVPRPRWLRERMLLAALGGPLLVAAAAVFTLLLPDAAEIAPSLRLQLIAVTVGGMVLAALIMLWIVGLFRRDLARLEGAARASLQRAVFDNAVAGIVRLKQGVISSCNRRFSEQLGYGPAELNGRRIASLIGEPGPGRGASPGAGADADGVLMQRELLLRRADGSQAWFLVSGAPADAANPGPDRVWVVVDIDDRKRTELALRENEARLYHAIKGSSDAIWDWDLRNDRYYMSPRMREFLGEGFSEPVTDRAWYEARMHAGDRARVAEAVRRHLEDGEPYAIEYRLRAADGSECWVRSRGQAVRDAQGRAVRFSGANTDITAARADAAARRQAEQASARARAFSEALVAAQPGLFLLVARGGRLAHWNANTERVTGCTPEELRGMTVQQLIAAEDRARLVEAARTAYREGAGSLECDLIAKDGARVPYVWSARRWDSGGERYLVATGTDLSERAQAEREVRAANQRLEERVSERTAALERANRDLEAFSYTVSHDLSAPLRAIDGFGALLEEAATDRLDPEARAHLARIRGSARQMKALIDDLLRLARVSRDALVRRRIDLADIGRRIVGDLAAQAPGRSVEFLVPAVLPAHADERLLGIALTNLLGNAWKFTGRAAHARIELGAETVDGETLWFVRDNGAGFDMRYADRLFKPFQRLHATHEFEGTGIGLAIVHSIIERHGGQIRVESALNAGATFHFTLG